MRTNTYLALQGTIKRRTEKAILFIFFDSEENAQEEWFPISQLASIHTAVNDSYDVIMASEWILKQKFAHHLATTKNPATTNAPTAAHPPVPTTPPAKSFVDMDDDIPL